MGSKSDALRPERLSLGNRVQENAVRFNNSEKHPVAGKIGGRIYAIILKPPARIVDVSLHVILGVGKIIVGATVIAPISFIAFLIRGHGIETNWTVKQGLFHFGYATLYFVDIFISPIVNLISPDIYPAKARLELQKKISAKNAADVKSLLNELKAHTAAIEATREGLEARDTAYNDLNAQLLAAEERHREEAHRLNEEVRALQDEAKTENEAHQAEVEELNAAYAELEQQLRAAEARHQEEQDRLSEELRAFQDAADAERAAMEGRLGATESFFNSIPAPPPPPPPPPPPLTRAASPSGQTPPAAADQEQGSPNPSIGSVAISSAVLGQGRGMLRRKYRDYVWRNNEHCTPDDPRFMMWANGKAKVVNKHAALLKILSGKLAEYESMPKDHFTVDQLREDIRKIEKGALEKEERKQASSNNLGEHLPFATFGNQAESSDGEEGNDWSDDDSDEVVEEIETHVPIAGLMGASIFVNPDIDYAKDTDELIAVLKNLISKKHEQIRKSIDYLKDNVSGIGERRVASREEARASDVREAEEARLSAERAAAERALHETNLRTAIRIARVIIWERMTLTEKTQFVQNNANWSQAAVFDKDPAFISFGLKEFLDSLRGERVSAIVEALDSDPRFISYQGLKGELGLCLDSE